MMYPRSFSTPIFSLRNVENAFEYPMFFSGCRLFKLVIRSWKPSWYWKSRLAILTYTVWLVLGYSRGDLHSQNRSSVQEVGSIHGSQLPAKVKTSFARTLMPNADSGFLSVSAAKAERDRATSSVCARVSVTLVMSSRKGILVCLCRVWHEVLHGFAVQGQRRNIGYGRRKPCEGLPRQAKGPAASRPVKKKPFSGFLPGKPLADQWRSDELEPAGPSWPTPGRPSTF
jgi:hypothetical protein